MSMSPRIRPDFLLLHDAPTPLQCLEAYATAEGVEFCRPYPNILAKAAIEFPQLRNLIDLHLPPEMIAGGVCAVLDGFVMNMDELPLPSDFMDG